MLLMTMTKMTKAMMMLMTVLLSIPRLVFNAIFSSTLHHHVNHRDCLYQIDGLYISYYIVSINLLAKTCN